ncbi:hypothetical protein TNIN_108051 [Trichonephila inaurata madagascariensis]|uniref:Uncharacterized protein n=1 Tax=Trichonephila inaurata madagascariensis TaxID=2747483 RepID=A0A8X7CS81_9ARAC|nr:hypothetical protein TNIN_108051 [Trichonephila inaurata madagascariensis]
MESNMDQHLEHGKGMDLFLPPSTQTSRPGTPQLFNCQRLKDLAYLIKRDTILINYQKAASNALRINEIADDESMTH